MDQRVVVRSDKKKLNARLDIIFAVGGYQWDNGGDLLINACRLGSRPGPLSV